MREYYILIQDFDIKQPWPAIHKEYFGRELKQNNATVCPDVKTLKIKFHPNSFFFSFKPNSLLKNI